MRGESPCLRRHRDTLASLKRSSTSCSSRALHRLSRGFSGSARNISPIPPINGGEPAEPAHPQDARAMLHRKSDHVSRGLSEGGSTASSLGNFVGKSSAQPDVFSSNTSSSRTVKHASTPTASPTTWNTPTLNATQRLDRNTSAEKGVPTRCRQRRKGSHINSDMSSLASGTSARGFRSGTSSFGKPTISKNLRRCRTMILHIWAKRPLVRWRNTRKATGNCYQCCPAILCCRRKQCTTPQI